jgi:hypothetical protein
MLYAVDIAAKWVGLWDDLASRGGWDVGLAGRLYESIHHLFWYPSKIKHCNAQISWQTVYNFFIVHVKKFATDLD